MRRTRWNRNEVACLDLAFFAGDAAGGFSFDYVDELVAAMGVLTAITEIRRKGENRGLGLRGLAECTLPHLRAVGAKRKDIWNRVMCVSVRDNFVHLPGKEVL